MRIGVLLVAVMGLALAACGGSSHVDYGGPASTTTTSPIVPSASVAGHTYLSTKAAGHDLHAMVITLAFDDKGSVSARAACNSMSGPYAIEDGDLVVRQLGQTEMGCPGTRQDLDTWLGELLMSRPALTLNGDTLELAKGSNTLTLLDRKVATPDKPVVGTKWVADTVYDGDTASSSAGSESTPSTLQIDGSTATGKIGCNSYSAHVVVAPDTLAFSDVTTTRIACPFSDTGSQLSALLGGDAPLHYVVDADQLTLTAADGKGLGFHAQS